MMTHRGHVYIYIYIRMYIREQLMREKYIGSGFFIYKFITGVHENRRVMNLRILSRCFLVEIFFRQCLH